MRTKLLCLIALVPLYGLSPSIASATIVEVDWSGTIVSGTDNTGTFGAVGANLAGDTYTTTYIYDTSVGTIVSGGTVGQQLVGGTRVGTTSASLGASITINGVTFSVGGSYFGNYSATCAAPCVPGSTSTFGDTVEDSSTTVLTDVIQQLNGALIPPLPTSLTAPVTVTAMAGDTLEGEFYYVANGTTDDLMLGETSGTLSLPSTPVPAALPLFATGLGVMGLLGWRRKRRVQAVA